MFESGQNWELFGYDTRSLGRHFVAAWKDLLWAYDSPLRKHLDETVTLQTPEGERVYQAGTPTGSIAAACRAVLLPDELVLTRQLRLPLAVEPDLEDALALEAQACSPFAASDTGTGWLVTARDERQIHVELVIVSLSAAMAYIGQQYGSHDAHAQEVWVAAGDNMVVVRGFGEGQREKFYRRRLLRVASMFGVAAILLLLVLLVSAGFKKWELQRLTELEASTQHAAADAMRLRSALAEANETIAAVNGLLAMNPSAHRELARLTRLLDDSTYVDRLEINGREIEIQGKAVDAAQVMESLTRQAEYDDVVAASPIRKLQNTGIEQFNLKVQLAGGGA